MKKSTEPLVDTEPSEPTDPLFLFEVKVNHIVDFNSNLSQEQWGQLENPFIADQFVVWPNNNTLLCISANRSYEMDVVPYEGDILPILPVGSEQPPVYDSFEVGSIQLDLVGSDFSHESPRIHWERILNMVSTNGAVGTSGDLFLKRNPLQEGDNSERFAFTTSNINWGSYNIQYSLRFSFKAEGFIKYCKIDPLIRTSGDY